MASTRGEQQRHGADRAEHEEGGAAKFARVLPEVTAAALPVLLGKGA